VPSAAGGGEKLGRGRHEFVDFPAVHLSEQAFAGREVGSLVSSARLNKWTCVHLSARRIPGAGISKIGPMIDLDVDGWAAMIDVNVRGVLHGIAAALPVFRRQGHGHPADRPELTLLRRVRRLVPALSPALVHRPVCETATGPSAVPPSPDR
jgi:hypothetical protein